MDFNTFFPIRLTNECHMTVWPSPISSNYRIFRSISRDFFQKFRSSGLYSGAAYVRTFPKNHILHAAHCTLRHASISTWSRSAHPQYFAITDCLCSRVATPSPPAVSFSLSLSVCVCVVSHSNGSQLHCSTWRPGRAWENSRLKSRAEHAALARMWQ